MKLLLSLVYWTLSLHGSFSITYLRPKNERGPGRRCLKCLNLAMILTSTHLHYQGAMQAGVNCLEQVERYFFKNNHSEQVQNLAVYHSKNMTSPAMEIEVEYLWGLHDRIIHQEDDEDSFQLKVISSVATKTLISDLKFTDMTLTDFVVVVADNINSVR